MENESSPDSDINSHHDAERHNHIIIHCQYVRGAENTAELINLFRELPQEKAL